MQVVIRMQDVERLAEVVDAVADASRVSPDMETFEGPWCVALYQIRDGALGARTLVGTLLEQIEAHGLVSEDPVDNQPWDIKIN